MTEQRPDWESRVVGKVALLALDAAIYLVALRVRYRAWRREKERAR